MKEENKLIDRFGRKGPWSVPEGYFDTARNEVMSKLPEYPANNKPVELSKWQRMKPYVYLAAMFAGIWCMMKIFHNISSSETLTLENPPEHIAAYMNSSDAEELLTLPTAMSEIEVLDEISDDYNSIEDFEKDFGYEIKPEYDNIDL